MNDKLKEQIHAITKQIGGMAYRMAMNNDEFWHFEQLVELELLREIPRLIKAEREVVDEVLCEDDEPCVFCKGTGQAESIDGFGKSSYRPCTLCCDKESEASDDTGST